MAFQPEQEAYKAFRDIVAEGTSRLLVWCGSGLSSSGGLPNWSQLRAAISAAQRDKAATLDTKSSIELIQKIEGIAREDNPWLAFDRLRTLGATTYRDTIREQLRAAATGPIPVAYQRIWDLKIAGVLNLNLDRLATRAFSDKNPGTRLVEFTGANVGSHLHVLKNPQPFVINLHGDADDTDTWVLTKHELSNLMAQPGYKIFINSALTTATVLFLGVTADDVAVGGHLTALSNLAIDYGTHYWLTDRRDAKTDAWAESAGMRVIRYQSVDGDHSAVDGFFTDLLQYVPQEQSEAPPIAFPEAIPAVAPVRLDSPAELVLEDAETIRTVLNHRAAEILTSNDQDRYDEYMKFLEEYDEAVHRAWYTSTLPGKNELLGYKLKSELARGAFGKVYRAESPKGSEVAIKVLLAEIRSSPGFLPSFRRGVRSMEILGANQIQGVVSYHQASEIPAFVVMDLVDGPNLKEAVEARQMREWPNILKTGSRLTAILKDAHSLPERVLHRDVRPANIMLSKYWTDPDNWDVVVLDFDLSWHRGAFEQSIVQNSGIAGYLAPEQIHSKAGVSTRHAAVDSFGVGMTLYFTVAGEDPVPNQHKHVGWERDVRRAAATIQSKVWLSLPERFARVVIHATRDAQAQRWDMSQIGNELLRLSDANLDPLTVKAADMLAEEIVARCPSLTNYEWHDDEVKASNTLPSGIAISVVGDETRGRVTLCIDWKDRGDHEWKRIAKWIPNAMGAAKSALQRGKWTDVEPHRTMSAMEIRAICATSDVPRNLDALSKGLETAIDALRFS